MSAIKRGDGKWNCLTRVPSRQGHGYYLCSSPATADHDENGKPTKCATHSIAGEARIAKKRADNRDKWRNEWERKDAIRIAQERVESALRMIAEGHNDARGLAQEVISALDDARKQ